MKLPPLLRKKSAEKGRGRGGCTEAKINGTKMYCNEKLMSPPFFVVVAFTVRCPSKLKTRV